MRRQREVIFCHSPMISSTNIIIWDLEWKNTVQVQPFAELTYLSIHSFSPSFPFSSFIILSTESFSLSNTLSWSRGKSYFSAEMASCGLHTSFAFPLAVRFPGSATPSLLVLFFFVFLQWLSDWGGNSVPGAVHRQLRLLPHQTHRLWLPSPLNIEPKP